MRTEHKTRAKVIDGLMTTGEAIFGRRLLNRVGAFLYWRTRGENLDDPERNGEYLSMHAVQQFLKEHRPVAFDIGANVGDWTALWLESNPHARAYAFEPVAATFAHLSRRLAGNSRVELCQAAVSDRSGTCEMRTSGVLSGSNSIYRMPDEKEMKLEKVATVTGDEFAATRNIQEIDFIKIDIEGHEVSSLRGFRRLITERRIRFIQWEYNKTWIPAGASLHDLFELLTPAGYRLCKIRSHDLLCYSRYAKSLDNYCYSNWLAIGERDYPKIRPRLRIREDTDRDW